MMVDAEPWLDQLVHDLMGPASTVLLWEEVLRDTEDPKQRAAAHAAIRSTAELQLRLVGDLRDALRARSGRLTLTKTRVALDEVVAEAVARVTPPVSAVQIERGSWIDGDPLLLAKALERVFGHTTRFAVPLTVELARRGDELVVTIATAEALPGSEAPSIGIVMAREIVALHGGELVLDDGPRLVELRFPAGRT